LPVPVSIPAAAWIGAAVILLIALTVYARQVRHILLEGGKVKASQFDLPELMMTIVFAGFFATLVANSLQKHAQEQAVSINRVLPNSLVFIALTAGIAGLLHFRGLRVRSIFGLDRLPFFGVLAWACGLILAAFPLAGAANEITMLVAPGKLEPQPLVDLFAKMVRNHDLKAMGVILASAVIIQPACEEFLFRGFFYGVWKRYLGPLGAGFLTCALFAAFHTSLAALAGLFILAVCLNIAYERTGSLFVPIGMHALFNLTSLLVIYFQAQQTVAS
jgi:hypothetical protein